MDITIHSSFLPLDDQDASLAFYRGTFERLQANAADIVREVS